MKKRGLSPVIATILLVAIVIVIGLIVFLWVRGFINEPIKKFNGQNVQIVCNDVSFEASYSAGTVYIRNTGNVPIYKMKAKVTYDGRFDTVPIEKDWPDTGLTLGKSYDGALSAQGAQSILLLPVLVGKTDSGEKKAYTCEDTQGMEIGV